MEDVMGYIKYMFVAMVGGGLFISWTDVAMTGGLALLAGFFTAVGGLLAKLFTNWLKRKWAIFRTKDDD